MLILETQIKRNGTLLEVDIPNLPSKISVQLDGSFVSTFRKCHTLKSTWKDSAGFILKNIHNQNE